MKKEYGVISQVRKEGAESYNIYVYYREGITLEYGQTGYGFFGITIDQKKSDELKEMICLYTGRQEEKYETSDLNGCIIEFESYKNGKIKTWRVMHELLFMKYGNGYKYTR